MVQSLLFGRPLFVRWENMMMKMMKKIKMNLPLLDLSASPQVKRNYEIKHFAEEIYYHCTVYQFLLVSQTHDSMRHIRKYIKSNLLLLVVLD